MTGGSKKGKYDAVTAEKVAHELWVKLSKWEGVREVHICGSLRRKQQLLDKVVAGYAEPFTVGDIDLVALVDEDKALVLLTWFNRLNEEKQDIGKKHESITIVHQGIAVDLQLCFDDATYRMAVMKATGSKQENIRLAVVAQNKGMKFSKKGLLNAAGEVIASTEKDVYEALGEAYKAPKDR